MQAASPDDPTQEVLLALICRYPEARMEAARIGVEKILKGNHLELARLVLDTMANNDNAQELAHLLERIQSPEDVNWRTAFDDCVRSIEKKAIRSIKDLTAQLRSVDEDSPEHAALLREIQALSARKSKL
jgi:hypothetical protein